MVEWSKHSQLIDLSPVNCPAKIRCTTTVSTCKMANFQGWGEVNHPHTPLHFLPVCTNLPVKSQSNFFLHKQTEIVSSIFARYILMFLRLYLGKSDQLL